MDHPLSDVMTDLRLTVKNICMAIRHKQFDNDTNEHGALLILIKSQMMVDELGYVLTHHSSVEKALIAYLNGDPFQKLDDDMTPETIHEFCLYYFEEAECHLGLSTELLINWIDSYADRHQALSQAFERLSGEKISIVVSTDQGEQQVREATDEEVFEIKSARYLKLIEQSHVLTNYNERMLRVHTMLLAKEPVDQILALMQY